MLSGPGAFLIFCLTDRLTSCPQGLSAGQWGGLAKVAGSFVITVLERRRAVHLTNLQLNTLRSSGSSCPAGHSTLTQGCCQKSFSSFLWSDMFFCYGYTEIPFQSPWSKEIAWVFRCVAATSTTLSASLWFKLFLFSPSPRSLDHRIICL